MRMLLSIAYRSRASAAGLPPAGTSRDMARIGGRIAMKITWLVASVLAMSVTVIPWALAQDTVGVDTQGLTSPPSSISSGSYGTGFYGPGLTGPGSYGPRSYGPGSYGPGSYGPGTGASTGPPTPFTYFTQGGPAAGGVAVPSAHLNKARMRTRQ